ncbi:MAG TPA: hypothetical protein VIJ72_07270, partial [Rhizomicrobium sp.]
KVVKETYNDDTGDYLTLKIFEEGHNQVKVPVAQEDTPHALPCFRIDDLYSYHARTTIARLLTDFLARGRLTVTELLHRADMLEKLEATGTLFQHAIQKIAVAQAATTTTPVQQIVKSLNELTTQALHRVYRDQRKDLFPAVKPEQFGALACKLADQGDGAYIFNGAIARHLQDASGWDEKVLRLLSLLQYAPEEGAGRALLLSSVDAIIAEILGGSAALHELIGTKDNLAAALSSLVELFLGKAVEDEAGTGLTLLTQHFADDDLPEARTAIANRVVAEFKSAKRLCPNSLVEELKALRKIANRVVFGVGKYMAHEELIAAFTLRSKRLVGNETLSEHLADAATPDEKIERLLFVEDNIIGVENKRQLAAFILPILSAPTFENHFQNAKLPVMPRLQKLAALQAHMRRSGFQDNQKDEIADRLDKLASDVEIRAKIFETIEAKTPGGAEKVMKILSLLNSGIFTEGRLAGRARELVIANLSRPGFLTGYVAHRAKSEGASDLTADKAMADLIGNLGKAGITAETGLKSIAA